MKISNFITLCIAPLMMNIMFAELKTFGMPVESDDETEQAPAEQTPAGEEPVEEEPIEEEPIEEEPIEEELDEAPEQDPTEDLPIDDEMPSASEDSELSEDQPVKFKEEYLISVRLGSSMPFGKNLKNSFSSGMNFQIDVGTPFSFSGIQLLGHLSMSNLAASNEAYSDYGVTNIGIKFSKAMSSLNIKLGTGLSLSSGTTMYQPYEDYSMTTFFISGGLDYTLPLSGLLSGKGKLEELRVSLSMGGIEIFGAPSDSGTSDLLDFGLSVSYPLYF